MSAKGVVATGHECTAQAAESILREGGNAFDAILAAHFAACVAEPVLASLGGGGFLLANPNGARPLVYDFFAQSPKRKRPASELDFRPILADFGTAQQEFHIGHGTIATPGSLKGMFEIYRDLCSMPIREITAPSIELAREGVTVDKLQAYLFSVVSPIYVATPEARAIFGSKNSGSDLLGEGEIIRQPELADTIEVLAIEGADLFYRGEIAETIVRSCEQNGGHLTREDLASYGVIRRPPLQLSYRDSRIMTNPPLSSGGILIAFALELLKEVNLNAWSFGCSGHLRLLAEIMALTNQARVEVWDKAEQQLGEGERLLDDGYLQWYRQQVAMCTRSLRGTTHMSVMDARGNIASMTVSNGEGCGSIVPKTGIMLNNMLGEEDINPGGFHLWTEDQRMTSMMAPTLISRPDGTRVATGSGGSNRIRTALLQVLVNLIDFEMDIKDAVCSPRIHVEGDKLSVEGGFQQAETEKVICDYPNHEVWDQLNLFFGGAHTVSKGAKGFVGVGDPRRGGVGRVVA